ncbi:Transcription factor [Sesamum alatum]|uniref:Transcription factor n=1 Tax=Sesamum alatum TaxID=300844 RepID=A0AAE1XRV3_9LAMI|nr:Transcription factor [Sesamum alatum]
MIIILQQLVDDSIFMDQFDFLDSINEEIVTLLGDDFCNSSSPQTLMNNMPSSDTLLPTEQTQPESEPPTKQRKTNSDNWTCSIPIILNFGNANSTPENPQHVPRPLNSAEEAVVSQAPAAQESEPVRRASRPRPPSQTYDHIVAERRRRELLSKRFAILSGMVPGLTKMDKTSVLGDAIKYLNQLQERVKTLEDQAAKQTMESVVLVKKSQITEDDDEDSGSSNEKDDCPKKQPLPEIEVRICNTQIVVRIQCAKLKGVVARLLSQVEKIHLTILNTIVVTLGNDHAFDITIIAEMEKESSVLPKEIVRVLHSAIDLRDT